MANKQDSNATGLRYAEEASLKTLPGTPVWYPLEPNKFTDFGGKLTTVARSPIDPSRQRRKGTITDLEASGAFETDLTQSNLVRLLQGFLFADAREKIGTSPLNGAAIAMTAVTSTTFSAVSGLGTFLVSALVKSSGFGVSANNGLWKLSAVASGLLTTAGLTAEATPPAAAMVQQVGYEFTVATLDVTMVGGFPRLNRASGAFDFTTLGLIPGEWIFLGGDVAANQFTNNQGFARVKAVAASYIDLDKTSFTPQAETGTGKNIRIFFGTVVKNEATPALIKRRTYQLERSVGTDANGTMSEVLTGAVASELTINVKQADKVTADLSFIACDLEQRDGTAGLKSGTRPALVSEDAFNTSSDFSRIKLAQVDPTTAAPTALFAFATDLSLVVKNNVGPTKAIGTLGAFDINVGTLDISGKVTCYFADMTGVKAVRANADTTIDVAIAKKNAGMVFDVPLVSLGDGRLAVEKDKPITLPLEMNAAADPVFNHTFLVTVFPYTPTIAE
jgi:hypothetical protein